MPLLLCRRSVRGHDLYIINGSIIIYLNIISFVILSTILYLKIIVSTDGKQIENCFFDGSCICFLINTARYSILLICFNSYLWFDFIKYLYTDFQIFEIIHDIFYFFFFYIWIKYRFKSSNLNWSIEIFVLKPHRVTYLKNNCMNVICKSIK